MDNIWLTWEKHYKDNNIDPSRICKDGVINIKKYKNAESKILFCLKDVNDFESGDLRNYLKNGPKGKGQMWHAASRWAAGLLTEFCDEYDKIDNYEQFLNQTAVINLKKASGGSSAEMSVINAYAKQDHELLLKQIESINPKILLACGTFNILIWLLDLKVNPDEVYWKEHPPLLDEKRGFWVIPWRHPGFVNNALTYQQLKKKYKLIDNFNL